MAAPVYATAVELTAANGGTAVPDAERLLKTASRDVRRATRGAVYAVDGDSMPRDSDVGEALHDATLAQALALAGSNVSAAGVAGFAKGSIASKSLGGASVTYATDAEAIAARNALAAGFLTAEALQVLDEAGLLSTRVGEGGQAASAAFMRNYPTDYIVDGGEG